MNKYYISELYSHAMYTAGKAREDIEEELCSLNYQKLVLDRPASNIILKVWLYILAIYKFIRIKKDSIVFFHFPVRSRRINFFLDLLQKKNIYPIAHIHDFEGIREKDDTILDAEIKILKKFKAVIVLNEDMNQFVHKYLPNISTFNLVVYDYKIEIKKQLPIRELSNHIAFAGNPLKAAFISDLSILESLQFHIYGNIKNLKLNTNTTFYGELDPLELPFSINGSFGLVWDGDSIDTCNGNYGEYLMLNLPHKLSLYIASGMPIIIWNKSALASFIIDKGLGFTVSSLHEIPDIINSLNHQTYNMWVSNLMSIREGLINGKFYENVILNIEEHLISVQNKLLI